MTDPLRGLKVLVVEDEPILLMTLEDILTDLGCHVAESAATLAHAEQAADNADYQVALLDVSLGTQPIESVARRINARNLPIVFASGMTGHEIAERFGADAIFIGKPYSTKAVSTALQRAAALA